MAPQIKMPNATVSTPFAVCCTTLPELLQHQLGGSPPDTAEGSNSLCLFCCCYFVHRVRPLREKRKHADYVSKPTTADMRRSNAYASTIYSVDVPSEVGGG